MSELKKHIKTIHNIEDSTERLVKCSCGEEWIITAIQFSTGDDKYDAHLKDKTGKFLKEIE